MIAVILAAGMSKRLRPLTANIPKCLLQVGESTLLTRYLNLLERAGVRKTIIVHGFNHLAVEKEVFSQQRNMEIEFILCEKYVSTHPIEGFLLTEEKVDDDFLLLNSDIYFSQNVLSAVMESSSSCVAIDSNAQYIENEMFVNYDTDLRVTEISKSLDKKNDLQGKSVQVTKFLKSDKDELFRRANELVGNDSVFYPAQAFDTLIAKKRFFAVDVAGEFTHELDTVEDYESLLSKIHL